MANEACSDTGPILHLHEISQEKLFKVFRKVHITSCIKDELVSYGISSLNSNFDLEKVNKDQVAFIAEKYGIDIGESSVIWLCKSMKVPILLTDDLSARETASLLGVRPVGSIGIVTRSFREGLIESEEAIKVLKDLKDKSSLFITIKLLNYAINEINAYRNR